MLLSGGGGCGKSVVVNCLYQCLHRCLSSKQGEDPEACRILLCAPTGKAAFLIHGSTLHSAFKINPNRSLKNQDVLPSASCTTLTNLYRYLTVLVLDECSMVGNCFFKLLNKRLQQIKQNQRFFGGVHVICVGDFFQLAPVFDDWVFENLKTDYGPLATNLWRDNGFVLHELDEIMRQKDDLEYAQLMNRLREGHHTEEDIANLKTCTLSNTDLNDPQYPINTPHIFLTNQKVNDHNFHLFDKSCNPEARDSVRCFDVVLGKYTHYVVDKAIGSLQNKPISQTANLMTNLSVALNQRYDITCNIDTNQGLANGMGCYLRQVSYLDNRNKPSIMWVELDDEKAGKDHRKKYQRFYTTDIDHKWTPIFSCKRTFYTGRQNIAVMREQFPLRPAAARTVHKSQGSSVSNIVIDLQNFRKVPHCHYVALSRVRNKSGLKLIDLAEDKICIDQKVVKEMKRLRENHKIVLCYTPPYRFPKDSLKVCFLNARSLHKHFNDVKNDISLLSCDIMAFAETRIMDHEHEQYLMKGFRLFLNCQPKTNAMTRPHLGLAVYVRESIDVKDIASLRFGDNEYIVLTTVFNANSIQVLILYRKCSSKIHQFTKEIVHLCRYMNTDNTLLVIGDFNCDMEAKLDVKVTVETHFSVKHIVTEPTFQNITGTISTIDHAFTNANRYECSVIECPYSDHKIMALALSLDQTNMTTCTGVTDNECTYERNNIGQQFERTQQCTDICCTTRGPRICNMTHNIVDGDNLEQRSEENDECDDGEDTITSNRSGDCENETKLQSGFHENLINLNDSDKEIYDSDITSEDSPIKVTSRQKRRHLSRKLNPHLFSESENEKESSDDELPVAF